MLLNEGKSPFEINRELNSKITKKEIQKKNRKYYSEVGLRSQLRKSCKICGRKTACNHRSYGNNDWVPNKPILLIEYRECTSCGSKIPSDCNICPSCNFYDPFKERIKKEITKGV